MTNWGLTAVLAFAPIAAEACSPRYVPLYKRDTSRSLIVRVKDYEVSVRKLKGTRMDVLEAEATLSLKQIKCWSKPRGFGKCPQSLAIDFSVYSDGANCPHYLEEDVLGARQGWRYFELSTDEKGGWYILAASKRLRQL